MRGIRFAAIVVAGWFCTGSVFAQATSTATWTAASTPTVRINEVLAATSAGSSDQIELYNAGATEADLSRWSLVDATTTVPFVFPDGTRLGPNGYLVVYARGTPPNTAQYRASFALDAEGDEVRLRDSAGQLVDSIKFGFQIPNFSIARTGAGAEVWALASPTFGNSNASPVTLGAPAGLRINEWAARIGFRLDHDFIELYNPATAAVALGEMQLTDDPTRPDKEHLTFKSLSFIPASGFLGLFGRDFKFGLNGDGDRIVLLGANLQAADDISFTNQAADISTGRIPDGGPARQDFAIPTPALRNDSVLPPEHDALLRNLRVTEVMFQPLAPSSAGDYEFVELQNIGSAPLALGGVRFTNGLTYTFRAGTMLAGGAFTVVARNRTKFLERYPSAVSVLAADSFTGDLDNTGETIALTLPAPWDVHILNFRFEPGWYAGTSGGGYSLVVPNPAATRPLDWREPASWRASTAVNGSPGAADAGGTAGPAAWLTNLSVRTRMEANQDPLIVGLVTRDGSKDILVRAAGPALAAFLPNGMADPRLDLYQGSNVVFQNDNWPANLDATIKSVTFPFATDSKDAAFVHRLDGAYTAQASGTGAGIVLVEAFDVGGSSPGRLINVSARNWVGVDDDILIAGFQISGTGSKRLLIRGVGPGLTALQVPDVLADPKLEIYSSANVKLYENDSWNSSLASTFTAVGAFALTSGSKDAALVVTLPAGRAIYTVQVKGADGGTGQAVVEVYEVP